MPDPLDARRDGLLHLAAALDSAGEPGAARRHRHEALTLLDGFTDPAAHRLRERLTSGLSSDT
ncbi:hypothetical protein ACFVVL_23780 [Kitasatospora sp. NPDC058115]|uniref:hypothetical protein n=1 Tax=Kitasatospora sp. NPDC058115 TaxID=3346347 RepID=UPI0036DE3CBA